MVLILELMMAMMMMMMMVNAKKIMFSQNTYLVSRDAWQPSWTCGDAFGDEKTGLIKIFLLSHVTSENFASMLVRVSVVCDMYCVRDVV